MLQCLLSRLLQVECLLVGRLQAEDGTRENRSDDIALGAKGIRLNNVAQRCAALLSS